MTVPPGVTATALLKHELTRPESNNIKTTGIVGREYKEAIIEIFNTSIITRQMIDPFVKGLRYALAGQARTDLPLEAKDMADIGERYITRDLIVASLDMVFREYPSHRGMVHSIKEGLGLDNH